jgi:hypothetical protein
MNMIEEAIAKIAATSEDIKEYCNNPENRCSGYTANLLERMSWELYKQAEELKEINYYCVV